MKLTLIVLHIASLIVLYIKCAKVLSLPRSINLKEHSKLNDDELYGLWESQDKSFKSGTYKVKHNDDEANANADDIVDNFSRHDQLAKVKGHNHVNGKYRNDLSLDIDNKGQQQQRQQQQQSELKRKERLNSINVNSNSNFNANANAYANANANANVNVNLSKQSAESDESFNSILLKAAKQGLTFNKNVAALKDWQEELAEQQKQQIISFPTPSHFAMPLSSSSSLSSSSNDWNRFFLPSNYWPRRLYIVTNENNCPQDYYRCSTSNVDRMDLKVHQKRQDPAYNFIISSKGDRTKIIENNPSILTSDDVLILLKAESVLMKLLKWILLQLNGQPRNFDNFHINKMQDFLRFYPSESFWQKLLNSSEFIALQKRLMLEQQNLMDIHDLYKNETFIPQRGRKQDATFNLSTLLKSNKEFLAPILDKRENLIDILKNDDLFYPNRGKRYTTNIILKQLHKRMSKGGKAASKSMIDLSPLYNTTSKYFHNGTMQQKKGAFVNVTKQ